MRRALCGALGVLACAVLAAPAQAASTEGTLIVLPAKGTLDTPMDVVTSGTCARGVTFVVAVRGAGIDPVTSGNAVGNTPLTSLEPLQYPGRYSVPLARTLRDYFIGNGLAVPKGRYDLVFACRNRLDFEDLQTFTGTVEIGPQGYRAIGDAATALEDFIALAPTTPEASSSESAEAAGGSSPAEPSPAESTPAESSAADDQSPAASEADPATPGEALPESAPTEIATQLASSETAPEDSTWRTVLIIMGALLLAGAGYLWWNQRRREA